MINNRNKEQVRTNQYPLKPKNYNSGKTETACENHELETKQNIIKKL